MSGGVDVSVTLAESAMLQKSGKESEPRRRGAGNVEGVRRMGGKRKRATDEHGWERERDGRGREHGGII